MNNTTARSNEIAAIAAEILAASGVDVTVETPPAIIRALARELAERAKCHQYTARRHIARAMRRARHPDYKAPGRGGKRAGAGRPPRGGAPAPLSPA